MSKNRFAPSSNANETAASLAVEEARHWARWLIQRESRGNGDRVNAMERIERKHSGVSRSLLWSLLYRPPRDMLVSKYVALRSAYLAECERQEAALRHEREITEAKSLLGAALLRSADRLVCSGGEGLNGKPRQ